MNGILKYSGIIPLSITVDGVIVSGEYLYSAKDILVRMTVPCASKGVGCHIMYACPKVYDEEYSEMKAREILEKIYRDYDKH